MSLDIYIRLKKGEIAKRGTGIYVRDNGKTRELALEEDQALYPDVDVKEHVEITNELWHGNITHNLNKMAMQVRLKNRPEDYFYNMLWHPDELTFDPRNYLRQMQKDLRIGSDILMGKPNHFRKYNPENGWGSYEGLVNFVEDYANALEDALEKFNEDNIEIGVWA